MKQSFCTATSGYNCNVFHANLLLEIKMICVFNAAKSLQFLDKNVNQNGYGMYTLTRAMDRNPAVSFLRLKWNVRGNKVIKETFCLASSMKSMISRATSGLERSRAKYSGNFQPHLKAKKQKCIPINLDSVDGFGISLCVLITWSTRIMFCRGKCNKKTTA